LAKAPRYKRQPEALGGIRISDRDAEIIKLVHDYRFMDSSQIQALVDGSDQVILRRLQKLFHHGYLDRPVSQIIFSNPLMGHKNMVYGLGDRGADLLAERFGIDRGNIIWKEKNNEVSQQYIQHTLMISNFRACLTLALRNTQDKKLVFWQRENPQELRDYIIVTDSGNKQKRLSIVPDGYFCIEDKDGRMYFFLEADRSTMTNARFLSKMRAYNLWHNRKGDEKKFGIHSFRVLTIAKTRKRMENLCKASEGAYNRRDQGYMFWFTCVENYNLNNPERILENIWVVSESKGLHKLTEIG